MEPSQTQNTSNPQSDMSPTTATETTGRANFTFAETTPMDSEGKKSKMDELIDLVRDFVIILSVVILIRTYVGAPFQISGSSMEKSYHDKELILVDKLSYMQIGNFSLGNPRRGDVVIFRPHVDDKREYYIKRIIALPGETIKFQDGEVFVKKNKESPFIQLNEDYLSEINKGKTFLPFDSDQKKSFEVPENQYFLMGDNRNNSSDSRSCFLSCTLSGATNFVSRSNISGKLSLDFGFLSFFDENTGKFGKPYWLHTPRFFNTPRTWVYPELDAATTK